MLTDSIEIDGRLSYIDIADDSETAITLGARYYVNTNFSVGTSYTTIDDLDYISLTARYSFWSQAVKWAHLLVRFLVFT